MEGFRTRVGMQARTRADIPHRHSAARWRVVVMGVAGSGKTTVGKLVAARLGAAFIDADRLHAAESVALMRAGTPLTDDRRRPWLHRVGHQLSTQAPIVIACSALARRHRDLLREHAADAIFVFLHAPVQVLSTRLAERQSHFMSVAMLDSQLDALEPLSADERGLRLDARDTPGEVADSAVAYLTGEAQ